MVQLKAYKVQGLCYFRHRFQFLMVQLKVLSVSLYPAKPFCISIPYGSIKSTQRQGAAHRLC